MKYNKAVTLSNSFYKLAIPMDPIVMAEIAKSRNELLAFKQELPKMSLDEAQEIHDALKKFLNILEWVPVLNIIPSIGLIPEDIETGDWISLSIHIITLALYLYPPAGMGVTLIKNGAVVAALRAVPGPLRPIAKHILLYIASKIKNLQLQSLVLEAFAMSSQLLVEAILNYAQMSVVTLAEKLAEYRKTSVSFKTETDAARYIIDFAISVNKDFFVKLGKELEDQVNNVT